jgi:hypothetical protein
MTFLQSAPNNSELTQVDRGNASCPANGAAAGTATYPYFGLDSLWIAAGFALMLAVDAALTNNAGQANPDPGVSIFRPSRPVDKQTR